MKFDHEKAKMLAEEAPLKRSYLASQCGIQTSTLTRYLNGHSEPSKAVVMLMAQDLRVPEADLWDDEDKARAS